MLRDEVVPDGKLSEMRIRERRNRMTTTPMSRLTRSSPILMLDIAQVISVWTGIPSDKLLETERERVLTMADKLRERVVGQDEGIEIVTDAIQRSRAGMNDPSKPIASMIFLGPT
jgi:ATP-dependent Clp protease ATP-binding subunit ClpA